MLRGVSFRVKKQKPLHAVSFWTVNSIGDKRVYPCVVVMGIEREEKGRGVKVLAKSQRFLKKRL